MTFVSIPSGAAIFLDANSLIYHFTNDAKYGSPCTQLIKRVELQDVQGGWARALTGPGLAIAVDPDALQRVTQNKVRLF
jgi:hypothetical protein